MTTATGVNFDDDSVRRLYDTLRNPGVKYRLKKNKKRSSEREGWKSTFRTFLSSSQEVSRFGTRFGTERGGGVHIHSVIPCEFFCFQCATVHPKMLFAAYGYDRRHISNLSFSSVDHSIDFGNVI